MAYDVLARCSEIERELERLDPAPFRRVLSRLLQSLEVSTIGRLSYDKKVKAAKDLAMLMGYAQQSVVINNNALIVERLNDVELLRELSAVRAQLAVVMPDGNAGVIGTDLASVVEETGGLGATREEGVYAEGAPPAHKTPVVTDANGIARPPATPRPVALAGPAPRKGLKGRTGKAPSAGEATPGKRHKKEK